MRFCFSYTKFSLNVTALIVSIFLYVLLSFSTVGCTNSVNTTVKADYTNTNEYILEEEKNSSIYEWKLEIPKIGLSAQIEEGTSDEILNKYIGHFENTNKNSGNVAFAAHNRGYEVNYFSRLKELEIGDEVIYTINNLVRIYQISSKNIIKDTDVEVLEETDENILTLITCVENEPSLRRCLIAKEIKDKEG